MTPTHYPYAETVEAARLAYCYGLLTAQAPNPKERQCVYRWQCDDTVRACAVGAYAEPNDDEEIRSLLVNGDVTSDDHHRLIKLQWAHDDWCDVARLHGLQSTKGINDRTTRAIALNAERHFLLALGFADVGGPVW